MKDGASNAEGKEVAGSGTAVDEVTITSRTTSNKSPAPHSELVMDPVMGLVIEPTIEPVIEEAKMERANADALSTAPRQVSFLRCLCDLCCFTVLIRLFKFFHGQILFIHFLHHHPFLFMHTLKVSN